jgi:hypothetical protein
VARRLVDHALDCGLDRRGGGFWEAGPGMARRKPWWVQLEAWKALVSVSELEPDHPRYRSQRRAQGSYIRAHLIDDAHGGVYAAALERLPRWARGLEVRLASSGATRKGNAWKDGSHEGRAWIYAVRAQRDAAGAGSSAAAG